MKLEKIEAGACDTGPLENCVSTAQAYSKKPAKSQQKTIPPLGDKRLADWRESLVRDGYFKAVEVVTGDLGPIAAIGSPLVCVGFGDCFTVVWMERKPWGWSNVCKTWLGSPSSGAIKYAVALAEKVKKAAEAEQARRERRQDAALRECGQ